MAHRREFAYKEFTTTAPVVNFFLDNLDDFQVNNIPILTEGDLPAALTMGPTFDGSNADAATITDGVLQLQNANPTSPGIVSTTTQTFAGQKSFTNVDLVSPGGFISYGGGTNPILSIGENGFSPSLTLGINSTPNNSREGLVVIGNNSGSLLASSAATDCTIVGNQSLPTYTSAGQVTTVGFEAGQAQTGGNSFTYLGWRAGNVNLTGSFNTFLGANSGTSCNGAESDNIAINSTGAGGVSGGIYIQDKTHRTDALATSCFIGGIGTVTLPSGNNPNLVLLDPTNDQLGVLPQSAFATQTTPFTTGGTVAVTGDTVTAATVNGASATVTSNTFPTGNTILVNQVGKHVSVLLPSINVTAATGTASTWTIGSISPTLPTPVNAGAPQTAGAFLFNGNAGDFTGSIEITGTNPALLTLRGNAALVPPFGTNTNLLFSYLAA